MNKRIKKKKEKQRKSFEKLIELCILAEVFRVMSNSNPYLNDFCCESNRGTK